MKTLLLVLLLIASPILAQDKKLAYTIETTDVGTLELFDAPCTSVEVASHLAPGFPLHLLKAGQGTVNGVVHQLCWVLDDEDDLVWMWDDGVVRFAPAKHPRVKKVETF
jgi:hypothetical protein